MIPANNALENRAKVFKRMFGLLTRSTLRLQKQLRHLTLQTLLKQSSLKTLPKLIVHYRYFRLIFLRNFSEQCFYRTPVDDYWTYLVADTSIEYSICLDLLLFWSFPQVELHWELYFSMGRLCLTGNLYPNILIIAVRGITKTQANI